MLWEIVKVLEERRSKLDTEIAELQKVLDTLPNGHLEEKVVKGKKYYYLRYWENGRLRSKYLGKDVTEIKEKFKIATETKVKLNRLIEERNRIVRILDKINKILVENDPINT
ncbi:hypothetical protein SUSAZ_00010 [Sulfolobus acidocaldarius SUSAZ]|nr:hypothetical protein SUSAZ_00010 [Sulfolobus acidocaldarius SUSAZ]